jgi:hypothetical protein
LNFYTRVCRFSASLPRLFGTLCSSLLLLLMLFSFELIAYDRDKRLLSSWIYRSPLGTLKFKFASSALALASEIMESVAKI